ncbi:unnamed protein product, partial [Rotaria magnacalcarata]
LAILPDTPLVQSKPELPRSDDIEVRWEDLDVDERKVHYLIPNSEAQKKHNGLTLDQAKTEYCHSDDIS